MTPLEKARAEVCRLEADEVVRVWIRETRIWLYKAFPSRQWPSSITLPCDLYDLLYLKMGEQNDEIAPAVAEIDGELRFQGIPIVRELVKLEAS